MPIVFQDRITRSMVREHSEWLFEFDDTWPVEDWVVWRGNTGANRMRSGFQPSTHRP